MAPAEHDKIRPPSYSPIINAAFIAGPGVPLAVLFFSQVTTMLNAKNWVRNGHEEETRSIYNPVVV